MDQETIAQKLTDLTELYAQQDVLRIEHDTLIAEAIPNAVHIVLADIDLEFADKKGAISEKITALEQDVKASVVDLGASVKGEHVHAVYSKGRMQWDTRGLSGYAVAHPEVGAFHTLGKPSVSLRRR